MSLDRLRTFGQMRTAAAAAAGASPLLTDLVTYYKLSDRLASHGGSSYDLTENNTPTYISGKLGNCLHCDLTEHSTLARGSIGNLSPGAHDWSLSFWFATLSGTSSSIRTLISVWDDGGNQKEWRVFYRGSDNRVDGLVSYNLSAAAQAGPYTIAGGLNTGEWHHVVLRYTLGTGIEVIVDNDVAGKVTAACTTMTQGTAPFVIGGLWSSGAWAGPSALTDIDAVGFWYRKLTDAEIGQLYNSGSGLEYPF